MYGGERVAWREIDKVRKKGIKFSLSELNNKRGRTTGEKNRLGKPVKSAQGERDPGLLSRKKKRERTLRPTSKLDDKDGNIYPALLISFFLSRPTFADFPRRTCGCLPCKKISKIFDLAQRLDGLKLRKMEGERILNSSRITWACVDLIRPRRQ